MKKLLKLINKHDNISMLIWLIILTSTFAFWHNMDANDELWNFSNIYKMYNDYVIYKDINVIITPLFFTVGQILFKLLGANYLVFRLYEGVIIYTFLFFIMYQVFKKLKIQKINSAIYTTAIGLIMLIKTFDGEYNILSVAFVILGIYYIILNKKNYKQGIIQGIIIFLIFMTKQNVSVYYLIGLMLWQLIEKNEFKAKIKLIITEIGTLLILILTFFLVMQTIGIWNDFINYAFLGIKEFATHNIIEPQNAKIPIIITIQIIIIASIVKIFKIPIIEEQWRNTKILAIFSILMQMLSYPIFNVVHILNANVVFLIFMAYEIGIIIEILLENINIREQLNTVKKWILFFTILIITLVNVYINTLYTYTVLIKCKYFQKREPYYGALIKQTKKQNIEEILNYIKEQNDNGFEVKIVSYYSNLYMNLLKRNNGDFDLPFYGNMGKKGEDGLIEKIGELKNTKILILTHEDRIYQESKKITDYIRNNLIYEGTIEQFSIFKTK